MKYGDKYISDMSVSLYTPELSLDTASCHVLVSAFCMYDAQVAIV